MKRPNVVLISLDTVRADHLSCYGYRRPTTPNIDRLASEGTVYRRHYSTGVWTPPGHASMLTGLYVSEHGVYDTRKLSADIPTIAEVLRGQGYQTAGFINNSQVGELVGLDRGHETFVEVWKGISPRSRLERAARGAARRLVRLMGYSDMGAARTNALFRDWLAGADRTRPFYAFIHYIEPHNPLEPPRPFRGIFSGALNAEGVDREKIRKVANNPLICYVEDLRLNEREIEVIKALYDEEIAYTDSKVGEVVGMLQGGGFYEDTLVIITADHGEHFGEHGHWSHVASLHEEVLRIPLVIKYQRGVERKAAVDGFTQLVDVLPTVMDAAAVPARDRPRTSGLCLVRGGAHSSGLHDYVMAEWEGRVPYFIADRLKPSESGAKTERIRVKSFLVRDAEYRYVLRSDNGRETYEVQNEAGEILAVEMKDEFGRLLKRCLRKIESGAAADSDATGEAMDEEIAKNLKALGYM